MNMNKYRTVHDIEPKTHFLDYLKPNVILGLHMPNTWCCKLCYFKQLPFTFQPAAQNKQSDFKPSAMKLTQNKDISTFRVKTSSTAGSKGCLLRAPLQFPVECHAAFSAHEKGWENSHESHREADSFDITQHGNI